MMSFTTEELNAGFMSTTLLNNYFHYFTGTNKLEKISPTAGGTVTAPFATNNRSFTSYDLNGNLTADGLRGTNLLYDRANLPYRVSNGNTTYAFGYNTADARIFKGNDNQAYYYLAGSVYDMKNDKWEHYPGGLAVHKNNSLHLIIKDHLTNTRAIVMDGTDNCAGSMGYQAQYDYYPFGKVLRKYESVTSRYKSTNHEKDTESGYDDRGARWWDDERLTPIQPDPHADKYPTMSPYSSFACNPISIIDRNGKDIIFYNQKGAEINRTVQDGDHQYYMQAANGNHTINGQNYFQGVSYNSFFGDQTDMKLVQQIDYNTLATKENVVDVMNNYVNSIVGNKQLGVTEFLTKSNEGNIYDFKNQVLDNLQATPQKAAYTAYMHEGVLYNRNEAGNLLWGAASARAGVADGMAWFAAQGYTLLTERKSDETGEWNAINQGRGYMGAGGFPRNTNFLGTKTQGDDPTKGGSNPLSEWIKEHSPFAK